MSGDLPGLSLQPAVMIDSSGHQDPGCGHLGQLDTGHRVQGAGNNLNIGARCNEGAHFYPISQQCNGDAKPSSLLHVLRSPHHLQHSAAIWTFKTSVTTILFSFLRWRFMDCRTAPAQRQSSSCESCEPIEDL